MARVVVIASGELDRDALDAVLGPGDELHLLVPAVEQSRLDWLTNDEDEARAEARRLARRIGGRTRADMASVEVKPDSPTQVVRDAIAEHAPDRVVVAVRDGEDASWLEQDELARLPRRIDGVPVIRLALTETDEAR
jgi:hypothetical protein